MKAFNGNPNQLNIFETPPPQMVERDMQGRTRTDIKKACKSLNEQVLKSITFKDRYWYIEGMDADTWISIYNSLDEKTRLADY